MARHGSRPSPFRASSSATASIGEHARPPPGEGAVSGRRTRGGPVTGLRHVARREPRRERKGACQTRVERRPTRVSGARQDRRQITAVEAARVPKWHEMWHDIRSIAENPWYQRTMKVPPAGFEPARMPPEGTALSPELRGPGVHRPYQRRGRPQKSPRCPHPSPDTPASRCDLRR